MNKHDPLETRLRLAALNVEPDWRASHRVKERLMRHFDTRSSLRRLPLMLVLGAFGLSAVAYAGMRAGVIPMLHTSLFAASPESGPGTPVVAEPLPAGMSPTVAQREKPGVLHAWHVTMPDGTRKLVIPPTVTLPDGTTATNDGGNGGSTP